MSYEHNAFVLVHAYIPGICRAVSSCCCCGKTIRANSTGGSHYVCLDCAEWIPGAKQRFDELQHRMETLEK